MIWVTVLIALLLSLAALLFVIAPLLRAPNEIAFLDEESDHLTELIGRKDATLAAIKELEFDYHVGKISDEDYQRFDQRLRRQAIGYLKQIETLAPQTATLDEALEEEIARHRRTVVNGRSGDATPTPRPAASTPQTASPQRFCTECGQPLVPGHKFCGQCGSPVATNAGSSVEESSVAASASG